MLQLEVINSELNGPPTWSTCIVPECTKVVVAPSPGAAEPALLDDQQEVVEEGYSPSPPESGDEQVQVAQDREKRRKVGEELPPDPSYFTRRCPTVSLK